MTTIDNDVRETYLNFKNSRGSTTTPLVFNKYMDFFKEHPYMLWGEKGFTHGKKTLDMMLNAPIYSAIELFDVLGGEHILKELLPHLTHYMLLDIMRHITINFTKEQRVTSFMNIYMKIYNIKGIDNE